MSGADIKTCRIYPGIGIARLGDSPEGFFIGPESPGLGPAPGSSFKDPAGRICRQAARFRIYGYDAKGNVVQEINALTPGVVIDWQVELANCKASGIKFAGVIQGKTNDKTPDPKMLRNLTVMDRSKLEIRASPRNISGANCSGQQYAFDDGAFFGESVYLGELRTDSAGRLLVLGGRGKSGFIPGSRPISHYANNDGWHDDTSDGRVTAKVVIDGKEIVVEAPAWVLVTPPKFAPYIRNVVSLYDVMVEASGVPAPKTPSFTRDIYPHFRAFADQQWVSAIALRGHGPQRNANFLDPQTIASLADNSAASRDYRASVLKRIRDPRAASKDQANYNYMPLLSGDEGDPIVGNPATWLSLPPRIYDLMKQWVAGDFDSDWAGEPAPLATVDMLPLAEQPAALDKASLEFCVGGPFFPGIEITYIATDPSLYSQPFRFDSSKLTPGDITKRMACPWQADFYECEIHWWPAQRPDDVLSELTYQQALADFPTEAAKGILAQTVTERIKWARGVSDHWDNPETILPPGARPPRPGDNAMVDEWKTLGFVTPVKTPAGETLHVEIGRSRFDGLGDRDYFFYLLNINSYTEFVPQAKKLALKFLKAAADQLDDSDGTGLEDFYRFFPYSKDAFDARLDQIYDGFKAYAALDPLDDPDNYIKTADDMVERIRQYAPLNQLDGAWLRNVARAGPIDEVGSLLFCVWMDEVGDGNPEQNHANVYTNLLEKVGINLPPINTLDYAYNPDMLDAAYTVPVMELAISQFTDTFYPEILGMTLQLEWEVLALWPTVKLLRNFGFDTHFYELHIGIDNAANGHGAKAKAAVERFLDEARKRGGEAEVQAVWRRIWTGYIAFAKTGTLYTDLGALLKQRKTRPETPADKVADIMLAKKRYGSLNHGTRTLGAQLINDLFEDPDAFMAALVEQSYIVPGHPEQSTFFKATSFDGPMYRVFTDEELRAFELWTMWLGSGASEQPVETDPGKLMAACIDHFRGQQQGTPTHQVTKLSGPDPGHPGQTIEQSVSTWFEEPTPNFMKVLADPANKFVVPGKSSKSPLITKILSGNNAMATALSAVAANTDGKTWKQIVGDWIDKGCPLPTPAPQPSPARAFRATMPRMAVTEGSAAVPHLPRRRGRGMGVVH
jgi:hypothetical protein